MEKKVLVPIAAGTEEAEAIIIIDLLRRADGVKIFVAGESDVTTCSRGVKIIPDVLIDSIDEDAEWDAIVLPGGLGGVENLSANEHFIGILKKHTANSRLTGAVCAAPLILAEHKIFPSDAQITSHPTVKALLRNFGYSDKSVVKSGRFITSRGVGTAIDFALAIIEELAGEEIANKVADSIVYDRGK